MTASPPHPGVNEDGIHTVTSLCLHVTNSWHSFSILPDLLSHPITLQHSRVYFPRLPQLGLLWVVTKNKLRVWYGDEAPVSRSAPVPGTMNGCYTLNRLDTATKGPTELSRVSAHGHVKFTVRIGRSLGLDIQSIFGNYPHKVIVYDQFTHSYRSCPL